MEKAVGDESCFGFDSFNRRLNARRCAGWICRRPDCGCTIGRTVIGTGCEHPASDGSNRAVGKPATWSQVIAGRVAVGNRSGGQAWGCIGRRFLWLEMKTPDPFFRILQIAAGAIRAGLDFYAKRNPADTATANRTRYVLDCLDAVVNRRPLPVLGASGKDGSK